MAAGTVAAALAAGLLAAPALGAPPVAIGAHHWVIAVSGRSYRVPAGAKFQYCADATVESVTPKVRLSARRKGEHSYSVQVLGPKHVGKSDRTEATFTGRHATLDVPFTAVMFNDLTANTNTAEFRPGAYRAQITLSVKKPKPKVVESVELVRTQKC